MLNIFQICIENKKIKLAKKEKKEEDYTSERKPRFNPNNLQDNSGIPGPVKAFQPIVNYNINVQNITIHQSKATQKI